MFYEPDSNNLINSLMGQKCLIIWNVLCFHNFSATSCKLRMHHCEQKCAVMAMMYFVHVGALWHKITSLRISSLDPGSFENLSKSCVYLWFLWVCVSIHICSMSPLGWHRTSRINHAAGDSGKHSGNKLFLESEYLILQFQMSVIVFVSLINISRCLRLSNIGWTRIIQAKFNMS